MGRWLDLTEFPELRSCRAWVDRLTVADSGEWGGDDAYDDDYDDELSALPSSSAWAPMTN